MQVSAANGAGKAAASAPAPASTSTAKRTSEIRHLVFPGTQSLGSLLVCVIDKDNSMHPVKQISGALGAVDVKVPRGQFLEFEPNRRIFENPNLMKEIKGDGIDCLKLGFISMDDREDGMCDRALAAAGCFKGLKFVDIDRSDATDKGLVSLTKIPTIKVISCFHTEVGGSSFSKLRDLPELVRLNMAWSVVDQSSIKLLAGCKKLKNLDMTRTGLTDEGMEGISQCLTLEDVRIGSNLRVTDRTLRSLLKLKSLKRVDLRGTSVTLAGIKSLHSLKLKEIAVPTSITPRELPIVRELYPGVTIELSRSSAVNAEDRHIFSPLK